MATDQQFELWTRELGLRDDASYNIAQAHHEWSGHVSGYWRVRAARSKVDWPVIIWHRDGDTTIIMQWGGGAPKPVDDEEFNKFRSLGFLHCTAVRKAEFESAVLTKHWPDGKTALPMSEEERLDIIPSTPASEGGNMPEGDQFHEQVYGKIVQLVDKAKALGAITSLEIANKAAEILEPLRALYKQGNTKREEERAPHLAAAAAVQAKWKPALDDAEQWGKRLVDAIDAFRKAEKKKLEDAERERQRIERERIAEETRQRLEAEAAARRKAAETMQMEPEPEASPDEIAAQAEQEAAEQVEEQAAARGPIEAPRVGTAYGRGVAKAKTAKAEIVDIVKFFEAVKDQDDVIEFFQKKANAAARAKIVLPGMRIASDD